MTADKLAGAICVYLMIGLTFAILFSLIEVMRPGAFLLPEALAGTRARPRRRVRIHLLQLLHPDDAGLRRHRAGQPSFARTLTWMEAATGQLYLAILIARLVGLHLFHRQEGS